MLIVTDAGFAQVCFQVAKEMEVTAAEQIDQKIIAKTAFQFARVFLSGNGITATVKDQRWRVAAIDRQHLADEDDVIAAVVLECGAALETGCAAGQQRQRPDAGIQLQSRELAAIGRTTGGK